MCWAVSGLHSLQAPSDILDDIEYVNTQLRQAHIPGDAEVESLVAGLLQQVTLKHLHCADNALLTSLVCAC